MPLSENSEYAKSQSLVKEDFNYRKLHVLSSFKTLYIKMKFHDMLAEDFYDKSVIFIEKICNINSNSLKFIYDSYDYLEGEEKIKIAFKQDCQLAARSYMVNLLIGTPIGSKNLNVAELNVAEDQLLLDDSKQKQEEAAKLVWGRRIINRLPGQYHYSAEDVFSWIDNIVKVIIAGNYMPVDGDFIGARKNDIEQYCANEFEGKSFSDILSEGLRNEIGLTEDKKQEQESPLVSKKRKSSSLESGTSSSMS